MLKLKYWCPLFDCSGYASCSRHYVKALIDRGVNITLSPVSFEKERPNLGSTGEYLSKFINILSDYDINLIHLTPEHYPLYKEKGKVNVGYTVWETNKLHSKWVDYCNCMDAILVPCEWNVKVFKDSGVTVPVYCVPHVVDVTEHNNIKEFKVNGPSQNDYIFYSIFQFNQRKDPLSLLQAYWKAFNSKDNVALVIKTYMNGYSNKEKQIIIQTIKELKQTILMPEGKDFAPVYLVLDLLTDNEILGLHKYGDCFVSLNRGEGFGLPEAEAAATGNPVITTGYGGVNQFLDKNNSYLLKYSLVPVMRQRMLWYTFDQLWAQADICDAASTMYYVYKNQNAAKKKGMLARTNMKDNFNYEVIGKLYVDTLEKIVRNLN